MKLKKLISILLCFGMLLSAVSAAAYAEEDPATAISYQTINLFETLELNVPAEGLAYLSFTPAESDSYEFVIESTEGVSAYIFDAGLNQLVSSSTYSGGFTFPVSMDAGATYYFGVQFYSPHEGTLRVFLNRPHPHTYAVTGEALVCTVCGVAAADTVTGLALYTPVTVSAAYGRTAGLEITAETTGAYRLVLQDTACDMSVILSGFEEGVLSDIGSWTCAPWSEGLDFNLEADRVYYLRITPVAETEPFDFTAVLSGEHDHRFVEADAAAAAEGAAYVCEVCGERVDGVVFPIGLNDPVTVSLEAGQTAIAAYTPDVSGSYMFFSEKDEYLDTYGKLFDKNMNQLTGVDGGGREGSFCLTYDLTAGETYYFAAKHYRDDVACEFTVILSNTHEHAYAMDETVSVPVSCGVDGEIWYVCSVCGSSYCEREEAQEHKYTLQVTPDGSVAYVCENCGDVQALRNYTVLLNTPLDIEVDAGKITYVRFVPATSGSYTFTAMSGEDTYGYLYDSALAELTYADSGGRSGDFAVTYNLVGGTTYYYGAKYYSSEKEGGFAVQVTETHDHDFAFSEERSTEPTCTEYGRQVYVCSVCGGYYFDLKSPVGHTFAPAGVSGGRITYKCSVCGATETHLYYEIPLNTPTEINVEENLVTLVGFKAPSNGKYMFLSVGDADTYGYLYDSELKQLTSADSGAKRSNFGFSYLLEAGKTYYFGAKFYNNGAGTITVVLCADHEHDDVLQPGTGTPPTCTESGEGLYVCSVCGASYWDTIKPLGHACAVAVKAEDGKITFVCSRCGYSVAGNYYEIRLDAPLAVNIDGGELTYIAFTPEMSDWYVLTSSGDGDTYAYLFDSNLNRLTTADGGGEGSNFSLREWLEKGRTYYYGVCYYDTSLSGGTTVKLTQDHEHIYELDESRCTATCTEDGYNYLVCRCGDEQTEPVEAFGHDYVKELIQEPSCTVQGIFEYTCTRCHDTYRRETPFRHQDEDRDGICDLCGKEVTAMVELAFVIDTTGSMGDDIAEVRSRMHELLNFMIENGVKYRVAIVDYRDFPSRADAGDYPYRVALNFSDVEDEVVAGIDGLTVAGGGDLPETVYSGLIDGLLSLDWTPGSFKRVVLMGDAPPLDPEPFTGYTVDTAISVLCGVPFFIGYSPAEAVKTTALPGMIKTKADAAPAEAASAAKIDAICEGEIIPVYSISSSCSEPHPEFKAISDATGGIAYSGSVSDISAILDDITKDISGDVHSHKFTVVVSDTATCTTPGKKVLKCQFCDETKEEDVPAPGHTVVEDAAVAATCTAPGKTAGKHCSVCGAIILNQETIPALGHAFGGWSVTRPATAEAEGEEARVCSRCEQRETRPLAKLSALKPGDVDGDGDVTAADARLALRASVKLESYAPGSAEFRAANVDGDGEITAADARIILRVSVKLETL